MFHLRVTYIHVYICIGAFEVAVIVDYGVVEH